MRLAERLRRLDEVVLRLPPPPVGPVPAWVLLATNGVGLGFLLLVFAVQNRTAGWVIAAAVYGAAEVPAAVAAARWHLGRGGLERNGRTAVLTALPLAAGVAVVVAAAAAPAPWAASTHVSYPRGCHPAPRDVVQAVTRSLHGQFRVDQVAVFGSHDAAAATALVSGPVDIGGVEVPMSRQPADYALTPGPFAAINDLAVRVSPALPRLFGNDAIGSPLDQLSADRGAAENCALGLR